MTGNLIFAIYQRRPPQSEREFLGWMHSNEAAGVLLADRFRRFNVGSDKRHYELELDSPVGLWVRFSEAVKALFGRSSWYNVYLVPPEYAGDFTNEIAWKVPFGYLWCDISAVNDLMCDVGDMDPPLLLYDQKRGGWVFSPANLPRIYWPPESAAQLFFGRNCRIDG